MTDFDPKTNRIPFALLSVDKQKIMKAWPHGWDYFSNAGWIDVPDPEWFQATAYRGKPAPVVTSKWFNIYPRGPVPQAYLTRKIADDIAGVDRIAVLRIDTCNGVKTAHLEDV